MTPKDKAKELVLKFIHNVLDYEQSGLSTFKSKQCALIAVDEIMKGDMHPFDKMYWEEVKKEINKL